MYLSQQTPQPSIHLHTHINILEREREREERETDRDRDRDRERTLLATTTYHVQCENNQQYTQCGRLLTNPHNAVLDIYSGRSGCVTSFAITNELIARRAPGRLHGLIALFSSYCRQNRIQTVCNSLQYS